MTRRRRPSQIVGDRSSRPAAAARHRLAPALAASVLLIAVSSAPTRAEAFVVVRTGTAAAAALRSVPGDATPATERRRPPPSPWRRRRRRCVGVADRTRSSLTALGRDDDDDGEGLESGVGGDPLPASSPSSYSSALSRASGAIASSPPRSVAFSALMALSGAALGPFLDSYHSAFGVLRYDAPIYVPLWGTADHPALITSWWVPPLFGLAGFLIGWLYVLVDEALNTEGTRRDPSPPDVLKGISAFTMQYWLSGVLYAYGFDRTTILAVVTAAAAGGFAVFDGTVAGAVTSAATAAGGPLIEVGLISTLQGHGGYHYTDAGETGFFPLWIVPVYFLGGPAVGNLARAVWNKLSLEFGIPAASAADADAPGGASSSRRPRCDACGDTRCVGCPNCDAQGYYVTYSQNVRCNCCKGRGYVMCRSCFDSYGDDPNDIEKIREIMAKMPD